MAESQIPGLSAILKKLDKVAAKPDPKEPIIEPVPVGESIGEDPQGEVAPRKKVSTRRQLLEAAAITTAGAVVVAIDSPNHVGAFFESKPAPTPKAKPTEAPSPVKKNPEPAQAATPTPVVTPTKVPSAEVSTIAPAEAISDTSVVKEVAKFTERGGYPIITDDLKEAYKGDEKKQVQAAYARYMQKHIDLYEDKDREFLLKNIDKNYEIARTLLPKDAERDVQEADKDLNDVLKLMIETSKQVAIYRNNGSAEMRVKNTTKPEWRQMRETAANDLAIDKESGIYKLHPGLVFVETGGVPPEKANDAGAIGLCQVKEDAGRTVVNILHGEYVNAKKAKDTKTMNRLEKVMDMDMKYKDPEKTTPNLFDPLTNMTTSLKYLSYLEKIYPDNGMTMWAYHMGPGNKATAIGLYLGLDDKDVKFIQRGLAGLEKNLTSMDAERMLANYVKTHHITVADLLTSDKVKDGLAKREIYDDTFFYVPRILAGMLLMNS